MYEVAFHGTRSGDQLCHIKDQKTTKSLVRKSIEMLSFNKIARNLV